MVLIENLVRRRSVYKVQQKNWAEVRSKDEVELVYLGKQPFAAFGVLQLLLQQSTVL